MTLQIEHQLPFQSLSLVELEPRMKEDVLVICSLCFRCVNQALLTLLLGRGGRYIDEKLS